MKIINFSVVEILPSLLDKSKTQNIRPAWEILSPREHREEHIRRCPACDKIKKRYETTGKYPTNEELNSERVSISKICEETYKNMPEFFNKPPKYKVGEKVQLFWKQRSKYKWFCKWCGGALIPNEEGYMGCKECLNAVDRDVLNKYEMYHKRGQTIPKAIIFNKHLGTTEITEVFKISMINGGILSLKGDNSLGEYTKEFFKNDYQKQFEKDLAKRDGFSSAEDFFQFFDKQYDLSSPKEFYVYRWKYIES